MRLDRYKRQEGLKILKILMLIKYGHGHVSVGRISHIESMSCEMYNAELTGRGLDAEQ